MSSSSLDSFLVTFGHDPLETTPDENEEENQGDGEHNQADSTGNNTANTKVGEFVPIAVVGDKLDILSINWSSDNGVLDEVFEFVDHIG